MPVLIPESGIVFGSFSDESCYQIESSPACESLGEGIKLVEFALARKENSLWFIEAKSSIPAYKENPKKHEKYFSNIEQKFINSLTLIFMGCLGRQPMIQAELPPGLQDLDWHCLNIHLRLVIPDVPKKFLPPLQEKFRNTLSRTLKTWNIAQPNVKVVNKEMARREELIQ